jgi:hypothetical protein
LNRSCDSQVERLVVQRAKSLASAWSEPADQPACHESRRQDEEDPADHADRHPVAQELANGSVPATPVIAHLRVVRSSTQGDRLLTAWRSSACVSYGEVVRVSDSLEYRAHVLALGFDSLEDVAPNIPVK